MLARKQKLIHKGKVLPDDAILEATVKDGATLMLLAADTAAASNAAAASQARPTRLASLAERK